MKRYLDLVKVKGIIQAGANSGQEVSLFLQYTNDIILCEPIPQHAEALSRQYPGVRVFNMALGSTDGNGVLHIASNSGESSSLLTPMDHLIHYRDVKFNSDISVQIKRLDTLIEENAIDMSKYNVLVTDTQGYDLEVIKGLGRHLLSIDLIISEYINTNLYAGNAGLESFKQYLGPEGFNLKETSDECRGAGNAIFTRVQNEAA